MAETYSPTELAVGLQIRALADAGTRSRDPNAVVYAVVARSERRRQAWMPVAAVASALGALVVAFVAVVGLLNFPGSSPSTAQVNGVSYGVGVMRSIDLSGAQLTPYADARQDSGLVTEHATAYQVDNLDPDQVLVMKLIPGQHDDSGSIGRYLALVRGNGFLLLCGYFAGGDPLAPTICR